MLNVDTPVFIVLIFKNSYLVFVHASWYAYRLPLRNEK